MDSIRENRTKEDILMEIQLEQSADIYNKKSLGQADVRNFLIACYRKEDFKQTYLYKKILQYQRQFQLNFLDEDELFRAFEDEVDFAELDNIEKMKVIDYEIEEDGDIERILGTLEIWSDLNGYVQWDGENISMGSALVTLGIAFSFSVENGVYSDFELEHVY